MHSANKRIRFIQYFFIICFVSISIYLLYFYFFQSKYVYSNSYNKRLRNDNNTVIRGDIIDRNGSLLVYSKVHKENVKRIYKYNRYFSHIIGYSSKEISSSGIEALYSSELNTANTIETIKSKIEGNRIKGNTLKLTIDKELQIYSSELLKGKKGAIIAINPIDGQFLL